MLQPISSIKMKLGIQPNGKVQRFFTNTCYKHMDKYVPRETGTLRRVVRIDPDSITYQSPYAHYLYVGKVYVMPQNQKAAFYSEDYGFWSKRGQAKIPTNRDIHYKAAGTGPYWDKRMVSAEMPTVVREVQKFVERR